MLYVAMEKAWKGYGGAWGDGKGAGAMGWCMGRWEGRVRDGEVYGAMGRAHEGWGGVWGVGKGAGGIRWCIWGDRKRACGIEWCMGRRRGHGRDGLGWYMGRWEGRA